MACVGLTLIGVVLCIFSLAAIYGIYANNKIFLVLVCRSNRLSITLQSQVLARYKCIHHHPHMSRPWSSSFHPPRQILGQGSVHELSA